MVSESSDFFFRQLFDPVTSTYTYLLADLKTKEALIIDPVLDHAARDSELIEELGLKLLYALNTHVHGDHVTGTGKLKILLPGVKSVIAKTSGAKADVYLNDGDKVNFGSYHIVAAATPGHTNGCLTYISHDQGLAFTGDALLIRGCGKTDFWEGNPETLYKSVHEKIFTLPDHFKVYPAHDWRGMTSSTIKEEKLLNPGFTKSLAKFVKMMGGRNYSDPSSILNTVDVNKACGVYVK